MGGKVKRRSLHLVRLAMSLAIVAAGVASPGPARAQSAEDEPEAFARVVVDAAELRSGPGVSYRTIYSAHRGETFALDGRNGSGF